MTAVDVDERFLAEKAEAIRALARRSVFEVGKHLTETREKCAHGQLGWSHGTRTRT